MINTLSSKTLSDKLWFSLLALYIVSGYFAQDVLVPTVVNSIVLYVFLAYSLFAILWSGKVKLSAVVSWEIVCLVFAFFAMLYSPSFSVLGGTYYALLVNFTIVFILTQMPWNEKRFDMVMKTFVASAAGLIISLALTGNLEDTSESGRLGQELTGNANILATMLMVGAIYAFWLLVSSNSSRITKFFAIISLVVIYVGMFLSGGRKYIIVPVIFIYILLINRFNASGRKHFIKSTVVVATILILLYWLVTTVPEFYDIIGHRFEEFFAIFNENEQADSSTLLRQEMVEAAWKKWQESPLWGFGFDSFKYYNAAEVTGHMYYSHNNFVELLYNQGILGFVAYYAFYAYLFLKALKIKKNSNRKGFALGVVISLLLFEYFGIAYSVTPIQLMLFFAFYSLTCITEEKY
ncbi:MAG: O-antigen ligase family protein [Clostridia bacterium]|nr:O-antigen ligase family protein [Clostridia bacterium]